ncbi:MAG: CdaR family protein [Anaerolineae bacterium]
MKASLGKKGLDTIGSAILALVLATVVWVNATYASDRPRDDYYPQNIKIEVVNIPNGYALTTLPESSVRVRIRAFTTSWSTLTASSFKATVDLANYLPGVGTAPVKVTCSDRLVSVIETQPQTLYVELELMQSVSMTVEAGLVNVDDLPLGYSAAISIVSPSLVTIEGPARLITQVTTISAPVSLIGQRASGERTVELKALDKTGKILNGLTIKPQSVVVAFDIERTLNYREVAVRALTTGHPAQGYYVAGITVDPGTVTVVGPPAVLASMPGLVATKNIIDVTAVTRTFIQRLPLDLPEGVTVFSLETPPRQDVFVSVEIAPYLGGATIEVPLKTRKLTAGLVAKLSVPAVDIIITGPTVVLSQLTIDLLDAYVDLGGLGVGKHQVKATVVVLVDRSADLGELTVTSISPEFIEVEILTTPLPTPTPLVSGVSTITPFDADKLR